MAQLVLAQAGSAIGSALLPSGFSVFGSQISGAAIGQAIGRLAGSYIDARYLSAPVAGPRIADFHLTDGREGAGIPVVYGRVRVGSQLIWAAQFRERSDVEGGKGGPRVLQYSYSLSFAVALCEGEIARVSRCWANGEPFDLSKVTWRLYKGTEDQLPDPLIEAVEGEAPAYRGIAYIVFEDLAVDEFGARMPQLSFEIVRPAGKSEDRLEAVARAVNIIPGTGEFALSTEIVRKRSLLGREAAVNLHGPEAKSDFEASIDQLEAELPNVTRVNLVVGWFGSDLRCGECMVRPGVETPDKITRPEAWSVGSVTRDEAYVVSSSDERPNYGGTPSDLSVVQAIASLKARGHHVTLYPFLLMDTPAGNGLPDPYGGEEQAAFPWRGGITTVAGDAVEQVEAFFEKYRAFILHYAALALQAEADGILIGSELVGLTRVREGEIYPAVDALRLLAGEVRELFEDRPEFEISYAADWTEYGAHVEGDDVRFPLDTLWADEAISYVGLDWYPPMADWRDGEAHADAAYRDGRSREYLAANVAGGEAFDWYYADEDGRAAQERLAITDGACGEPFVFRQKDVAGWWGNAHHPRIDGVRSGTPTGWVAGMKPVRFVEMGAAAVDKGANQPNVFYDPKSSESGLPYFSDGSRDDLIQRAAIEAFHAHWSDAANNPVSNEYEEHGGRMVPEDGIALWAWDARPFPSFPALDEEWGDAGNWRLGHWLNGRAGAALLPDVVADVCGRVTENVTVSGLTGIVSGYRFDGPIPARSVLAPVAAVDGVDACERDGRLVFRMRGAEEVSVGKGRLVEEDAPSLQLTRAGLEAPDVRVRLRYIDAEAEHEPGAVLSAGLAEADVAEVAAALAMDRGQAAAYAEALAEELRMRRERARFAMAADGVAIEAGDVVRLGDDAWRVTEVSDGAVVRFEAVRAVGQRALTLVPAMPIAPPVAVSPVEPDVVIVDGPPLPGEEDDLRPLMFAFADPWAGPLSVSAGADASSLTVRATVKRPCAVGELVTALFPYVSGRWQDASVWVRLPSAALQSRSELAVLNGANAALVETEVGWELVQFEQAELVDEETWKLSRLLRGQQGSEPAMAAGAEAGVRILVLTGAERRLGLADWERGLELTWRVWRERPEEKAAWSGEGTWLGEAGRMWSPAHLTGDSAEDGLRLAWVRRARKGGDSWGAGEPPHEVPEQYRVRISSGGAILRQEDVAGSSYLYPPDDQATDFPTGGEALVEIAQLGRDWEPGAWTGLSITIPAP
ncbi:MAG TPA: glycoside hydrolase/phage tail family protein [Hyphomonadaceae bacterium]|nr:glycoside hydrolase/phage tail family protein [Hyphomonadaceae bacterium]